MVALKKVFVFINNQPTSRLLGECTLMFMQDPQKAVMLLGTLKDVLTISDVYNLGER